MSDRIDMTVDFAGLGLANPVFTASGTCGYADELGDFMDLGLLGGFITKSITPLPRKGNATPRVVETDAGMLNAIGLANIGMERFVEEKLPVLAKMKAAVFVNAAGATLDDYLAVVDGLSGRGEIAGFELNISCPNVKKGGIAFGTDAGQVTEITREVKGVCGDKVLMVKLSPNVTDISVTARAAVEGGADALSLINTLTGMAVDVERQECVLANRTGGLSGPAIKPVGLYMVDKVYREVAKDAGVPILGVGGIRTATDAIEFMLAGAAAVAVGTASLIEPDSCVGVVEGIESYCRRKGIGEARALTGRLR